MKQIDANVVSASRTSAAEDHFLQNPTARRFAPTADHDHPGIPITFIGILILAIPPCSSGSSGCHNMR
jgi:hypothetical protein